MAVLIILVFDTQITNNNQLEVNMQEQTFSLQTEFRIYRDADINALLFEEILNSSPETWSFMVLEPDRPIQSSHFMQVVSPNREGHFFLEIGFGATETGYSLYLLCTEDKNVVLQHLIAYWQNQIIPDVSSWEDIST